MDYDKLKQLVSEGYSVSQLAETFSLGQTTIRYHLKKCGARTEKSISRKSWTDEQLINAVNSSETWSDVISTLGLKKSAAGNFKTVKQHVQRLGLDTSHFIVGRSSGRGGKVIIIQDILVENSTYNTSGLLKKLIDAGLKQRNCEMCGLDKRLGNPIALEVDHINGINTDHRIENLRVLCPNCHATTPTWRGRKNKK